MRARTCKAFDLSKLNQFHSLHILDNSLTSLGHKHTQKNLRCLLSQKENCQKQTCFMEIYEIYGLEFSHVKNMKGDKYYL